MKIYIDFVTATKLSVPCGLFATYRTAPYRLERAEAFGRNETNELACESRDRRRISFSPNSLVADTNQELGLSYVHGIETLQEFVKFLG